MKPPLLIVITVGIMAAICASLGWIAVTEHELTTGGRLGVTTSHGLSAVVAGWLWFAAAVWLVGVLASGSRFRKIIWLGLLFFYVICLAIYGHWFYAPLP